MKLEKKIKYLEIITKFLQFLFNPILKHFNYLLMKNRMYDFETNNMVSFQISFDKIKKIDNKNAKLINEKIIYKITI